MDSAIVVKDTMKKENDGEKAMRYIEPEMEITVFEPGEVFTISKSNELNDGKEWTVPLSLREEATW